MHMDPAIQQLQQKRHAGNLNANSALVFLILHHITCQNRTIVQRKNYLERKFKVDTWESRFARPCLEVTYESPVGILKTFPWKRRSSADNASLLLLLF